MPITRRRETQPTRTPSIPTLWENFFGRDWFDMMNFPTTGTNIPSVNIWEDKENYYVEVAAPGMKKDDFNIEIDNDMLIISAEKETTEEEEGRKFTRREYNYTNFQRTFTLPNTVNTENIKAEYKDGVLRVMMAKKEEAKEKAPKTIQVA